MNVIHRVFFAKVLQCYHNACFTFFTYFYASFLHHNFAIKIPRRQLSYGGSQISVSRSIWRDHPNQHSFSVNIAQDVQGRQPNITKRPAGKHFLKIFFIISLFAVMQAEMRTKSNMMVIMNIIFIVSLFFQA